MKNSVNNNYKRLLFVFVAPIALSTYAAGGTATLSAWIVWGIFSIPGFAILRTNLSSPMSLALSSLMGLSISIFAIAAVGLFFQHLSIMQVTFIPMLLALVIMHIRKKYFSKSELEVGLTCWQIVTPLIALGLSCIPICMVGVSISDGSHFHAYFNADFFKHIANSEALALGNFPPPHPFSAGMCLNYYWGSYLLPATVIRLANHTVTGTQAVLAIIIIQTCALGLLAFYACLLTAKRNPKIAAFVSSLAMLSLSLDGITSILGIAQTTPIQAMQATNQESLDFTELFGAVSALSGSTLQRLCLYLPQHQLAISIFLVWIILFLAEKQQEKSFLKISRPLLVLSLPIISLWVGILCSVMITIGEDIEQKQILSRFKMAVIFLAAISMLFIAKVISFSPTEVLSDPFLKLQSVDSPLIIRLAWMVPQFVTTFGALYLIGIVGAWLAIKKHGWRSNLVIPQAMIIAIGVGSYLISEIFLHGRLRVETELKTSFFLNVGLMLGSAYFFSYPGILTSIWKKFHYVYIFLFFIGLVSPIHDIIWHSTTSTRFETVIPSVDMHALNWIRKNTPLDAIFQQPLDRPFLLGGKDSWVAIFGGRGVAVAGRAANVPHDKIRATSTLFSCDTTINQRKKSMLVLNVNYVYLSRSLLGYKFDKLCSILKNEGWVIVYEIKGVLIIKTIVNST